MIEDLLVGQEVYLVGLLKSVRSGKTRNGDPYLDLEITDRTGSIMAKMWDSSLDDLEKLNISPGTIVYSRGLVGEYQGRIQFTIETREKKNILNLKDYPDLLSKYDLSDYIPMAPLSFGQIKDYLLWSISQIKDEEIRSFLEEIMADFGDQLISFPASLNVHHEYINGLGYHIYRMMGQVFALRDVYTDGVNWDYLIAGVLVHDLGKIRCYEMNDMGLPTGYSLANDLHGHIAIAYNMVEEYGLSQEKKEMIQHLILSHHGKREFGAVVTPMTLEAHMLHFIDNLDATITMVEKEMDKLDENEVSQRIWYLDNTKLYKEGHSEEESGEIN